MGFNDRFWDEEITLNYLQNCKSYQKMKSGESESDMVDIHIEAQVREIWGWHMVGFDEEGGAMSPGMQVAHMSWNMPKNDFPPELPEVRQDRQLPDISPVKLGSDFWPPKRVVVQSLSHVQLLVTPRLQHSRFPCPSLAPGVCSNWKSVGLCCLKPLNLS